MSHEPIQDGDSSQLHYCICVFCGAHMILMYDGEREEYVGACDKCNMFSPLSSNPPYQQ